MSTELNLEAERAAFKAWYLDPDRKGATFGYQATRDGIYEAFQRVSELAWLERSRRASPAAAVPEGALPPLPNVQRYTNNGDGAMIENPDGVWCYYEDARAAVEADRAQQGEPVDGDAIAKSKRILSLVDDYVDSINVGGVEKARDARTALRCALMDEFEAATKAAAPADAAQPQEMSVRVAPAPAGQHDADELVALGAKMAAWLFGLSKSGLPYESWAEKCAEYSAAWDSVVATSRAQRTTIDKLNSAAPVPDTGIPKDHEIREAVNTLRDIAVKYHSAQQLREQIAYFIVPLLRRAAPVSSTATAGAVPDPCDKCSGRCSDCPYDEDAAPQPPEAKAGEQP